MKIYHGSINKVETPESLQHLRFIKAKEITQ